MTFSLWKRASRPKPFVYTCTENGLTIRIHAYASRQFPPRRGLNMDIKGSENSQADSIRQEHSERERCEDSSHQ